MSEVKVNKISPRTNCGTTTLGDSGDSFVIPSGVTITNNGTQTGFGREGSVNWQTSSIKTATFTATSGEGYFCNTSGGAFTVNLPAGSAGAIVSVSDYTRTWQTNNLTVSPNGSEKIGGIAQPAVLSTEGQAATFVYVDATEGWINVQETSNSVTGSNPFIVATGGTITTSGDCKIHTFTGPGTFTVCTTAEICGSTRNVVSYMVIAGGGAGGSGGGPNGASGASSGGGGAGGFRELKTPLTPYTASPLDGYPTPGNRITVTEQGYPITVGGGGTAPPTPGSEGTKGSNSIFSSITSTGGGQGATRAGTDGPSEQNGKPGGSGGGGLRTACGPNTIGSGNTPPVTPPQGNDGGSTTGGNTAGGGGGGATAAGSPISSGPTGTAGGAGGAGATTGISGSNVARAGGGGGAGSGDAPSGHCNAGGAGGTGGGGAGGGTGVAGSAGTDNTGGGGGGGGSNPGKVGAAGGSGIVIIRYKFQ